MVTKAKKKVGDKVKKTEQASTEASDPIAQVASGTASSLEQVRDILFGEQVREQNNKYSELHGQLSNAIEELRTATAAQFETLTKDMQEQMSAEQKARQKVTEEIFQKLDDLSHDISELDTKLGKTREELYDHVMSESKQLSDEMHDLNEKATTLLKARADELQDTKIDREKLAEMFVGMASSLTKGSKTKS